MKTLEKLKEVERLRKELLNEKMQILVGIRVLNFRIGITKNKKKNQCYLYASRYQNGKTMQFNIGKCYSLRECEDKIREKLEESNASIKEGKVVS